MRAASPTKPSLSGLLLSYLASIAAAAKPSSSSGGGTSSSSYPGSTYVSTGSYSFSSGESSGLPVWAIVLIVVGSVLVACACLKAWCDDDDNECTSSNSNSGGQRV
eukprot:scaffold93492_cov40-Tisochrysis_lutea.AAC.3